MRRNSNGLLAYHIEQGREEPVKSKRLLKTDVELHVNVRCELTDLELSTCEWIKQYSPGD